MITEPLLTFEDDTSEHQEERKHLQEAGRLRWRSAQARSARVRALHSDTEGPQDPEAG